MSPYVGGTSQPSSASQCAARSRHVWIATRRLKTPTSRTLRSAPTTSCRAVASARNASADGGRTERMRAVASRTAAILLARTALSTTSRRRAQDAGRAPLLDGLEVEVVENGAGLARRQRLTVALDEH